MYLNFRIRASPPHTPKQPCTKIYTGYARFVRAAAPCNGPFESIATAYAKIIRHAALPVNNWFDRLRASLTVYTAE